MQQESAPNSIFFVGMMASGKSTVGRYLAGRIGWDFYDIDKEIEARTGVPVSYIFEREGEAGFRLRETKIMAELTERAGVVVSMGGGAPMFDINRMLLKRGLVVQLVVTVSDVIERTRYDTSRPLLQTADPIAKIRHLMLERGPIYDAVSNVKLTTSRMNPNVVVDRLLEIQDVVDTIARGNLVLKSKG